MGQPLCPKCGKPVRKCGTSVYGKQRWKHSSRAGRKACAWHGTDPVGLEAAQAAGVDPKTSKQLAKVAGKRGARRLVITAAQNATPVNKAFLRTLLTYCAARRAQLLVIPYRYKNPTSMWSKKAEHDDWWASEIVPYLIDVRTDLNANLVLLADIKTQPTASGPLQGFETVTGARSAIIGHPKLSLKTVPTPQSRMAKILTTTGAVTEKNYIPAKAGKKAEHHHTFGACVVELDGKEFHLRQLNAMRDGSFCDLNFEYAGDKVTERRIEALVMGDTHQEFIDPAVVKATFEGKDSMVAVLKPKKLVWHDLHDFYSRNHHHKFEPFINFAKHHSGTDDVRAGLEKTFTFVDRVTPAGVENIIVPSNHPDALARWVKECDPKTDPRNAVFWAETFTTMLAGARMTRTGAQTIDPFAYWGRKMLKTVAQANFLARGVSHAIKDVECGYHADKGPNGGPGTLKAYSKIGVKTITGHRHAPGIEDGAYGVGHSCYGDLEYASGAPSSWLPAHCLLYGNGKRSLAFIIGEDWRA